jgi:hypothetical protein
VTRKRPNNGSVAGTDEKANRNNTEQSARTRSFGCHGQQKQAIQIASVRLLKSFAHCSASSERFQLDGLLLQAMTCLIVGGSHENYFVNFCT